MSRFVKLTLADPDRAASPEVWINIDQAVTLRRDGDRTLIDFLAPRHVVAYIAGGEQYSDTAPRRIEVLEPPELILEQLSERWASL